MVDFVINPIWLWNELIHFKFFSILKTVVLEQGFSFWSMRQWLSLFEVTASASGVPCIWMLMEKKTGILGEASLSTFVRKDTKFLNNSGFLILLITSIKDGVHIIMDYDLPPQHFISSFSLGIYFITISFNLI